MRILIVSALFPPAVIGGAELSAWNLACRLRDRGHHISILTTADAEEAEELGVEREGMSIWRMHMPRMYPISRFPAAPSWQKPLWHLQDHFDPRNRSIMRAVLRAVNPDIVNVQYIQGLGYNALAEIAQQEIPTLFTLHDLGLACTRMSMFRGGKDCKRQCSMCRYSAVYKLGQIQKFRRISFCSPSDANLRKVNEWFPLRQYPKDVLLNANRYPAPTTARIESETVRLLFVGRLHPTKGIAMLLEATLPLAQQYRFNITIVGGGPEEAPLRLKYGALSWCNFVGHVPETAVSNHMANSDLLCVPSLWSENSPGVVIHALSQGLPVLGSNKGGIPELVRDGITGRLVDPGDLLAWQHALRSILENPSILKEWRLSAMERAGEFDPGALAAKYEALMVALTNEGSTRCR